MLNTVMRLFGCRSELRIYPDDMSVVKNYQTRLARHTKNGPEYHEGEIVGRSTLVLHLEYQGQRVVYKGVCIRPGHAPVLGRRYEA